MTDAERQLAIEHLIDGRDSLLTAIADLSDAQAHFKPDAGRWSIAECTEHVAITGDALLALVQKGVPNPQGVALDPAKYGRLAAALVDRSRKFPAPDLMVPTGRFASIAGARAYFLESHERVMTYTLQCQIDLRRHFTMHPLLGEMDCFRCLLLLALHPARHAAQICEIKLDPRFPEK
ncbi:MAG: DinB family protein [Candidatus Solibacter usitatus]|nr:DinB family protein [Candidatus Solibacter usitatus]